MLENISSGPQMCEIHTAHNSRTLRYQKRALSPPCFHTLSSLMVLETLGGPLGKSQDTYHEDGEVAHLIGNGMIGHAHQANKRPNMSIKQGTNPRRSF